MKKLQMINIPATTLNALKQMLFNSENGTDLTNIINDLGGDDLTAIHVGLCHKGIKPEICQKSRYSRDYSDYFYRYDFVGFSMILNQVRAKRTRLQLTENNDAKVISKVTEDCVFDIQRWEEMSTEADEIINEINNRKK